MTATMCNPLDGGVDGYNIAELRDMVCEAQQIDVLDEYPSLGPLFVQAGLTASELDKFLTMMEQGITYKETPEIMREDMASLHGDAVLVYADMVGGSNV